MRANSRRASLFELLDFVIFPFGTTLVDFVFFPFGTTLVDFAITFGAVLAIFFFSLT